MGRREKGEKRIGEGKCGRGDDRKEWTKNNKLWFETEIIVLQFCIGGTD